jgi:ketosteroid isomerase-like protein
MTVDGGTEIDEIEVIDGWAWMRTRINVTMTPPTGEPNQRSGCTLAILRKEPDGRWVLARDANLLPT